MSIVKLIDDCLVEFGNERFLEGWNGATERIIKITEEHALLVDEGGGVYCNCNQIQSERAWDYQNHLLALIKGENK